MEKIKVLVKPSNRTGSGKFRSFDPHICLQENHGDEFFVEINKDAKLDNPEYLKQFSIAVFHRTPSANYLSAVNEIKNLQKLGIKVVIDIDDYWILDHSHGSYKKTTKEKLPQFLASIIIAADLVTVPTPILADAVRKLNKNVAVLPNAINIKQPQFIPKPTTSDRVRFGWLGGSSHIDDIKILEPMLTTIPDFNKRGQMVLCGFDNRGKIQQFDKTTNKMVERDMKPHETVWFLYEVFMSNKLKLVSDDAEYLKHLMTFDPKAVFNDIDKPYRRIWTKPVNEYAYGYNNFDVSLAPLKDSTFNLYKSQLKVIEAGFMKKAIIAQNYGPYTLDLIPYFEKGGKINPKGNALLVDTNKNHKQWGIYIKKLLDNPELVHILAENLYNTVKDKYNLDNVTKERRDVYLNLLK